MITAINLFIINIVAINKACDIIPKVIFLGKELFRALGII